MANVARAVLIVALVATTALTPCWASRTPPHRCTTPHGFSSGICCSHGFPSFFAAGFAVVHRRVWLLPLGLGWLAFLPNSPYLVTDLVHLSEGVELWRHVLQYGFAAWTGIMLGVVSMRLIHARVEREYGAVSGWAAVVVSIALCSIGVVVGRFQRWNSWDLMTQPHAVVTTTFKWVRSPFAYVQSTGVALAVAAFFGLAYLTVWSLGGLAIASSQRIRS